MDGWIVCVCVCVCVCVRLRVRAHVCESSDSQLARRVPPPSAIGRQALLHDFIMEFRSPTARFYYHTDQHTVESFVARLGERLAPALAAPFEEVVMPDFVPDPAAKKAVLQVRRGRRRRRRHAQQPPPAPCLPSVFLDSHSPLFAFPPRVPPLPQCRL